MSNNDMYREVRGEPSWESASDQSDSDESHSSTCSSSCSSHTHSSCDTCSSSFTSSSSSITPPWEAYIKPSGDLFYVSLSQPSLYGMGQASAVNSLAKEKTRTVSKDGKAKSTSRWAHFLKTKKRAAATQSQKREQSPPYTLAKSKNHPDEEAHLLYESWKLYSVHVRVDLRRKGNMGRKTSICEALLGFVPSAEEKPLPPPPPPYRENGHRVFVRTILQEGIIDLPESPVNPGDWFYKFDGNVVTRRNLQSLLESMAEDRVVHLEFKRNPTNEVINASGIGSAATSNGSNPRPRATTNVASATHRRLRGCVILSDPFAPPVLPDAVYGLALLSTEGMTEDSPDRFDIRYQWPSLSVDEPQSYGIESLLKIRGVLSTLDHLLPEVVASGPQSSAVVLDGTLTHVSYLKADRMLSILALPAHWTSSHDLRLRHADIHRLLTCQYGSLAKAFAASQSSELDNLLRTLLEPLAAPQATASTSPVSHIHHRQRFVMAPYLPLSPELQFDVESALNELESADYQECEDECLPERRDYTMVGSCLYYKGYLLMHTLPVPDMEDVTLVLSGTKLLLLTARTELNQAVLWKEIFPTEPPPYVKHLDRRYFLLCVGRGHMLVAMLLESGACAQTAEVHPKPDSFLVEQIEWTLEQLEGMRLPALCDKSLSSSLLLHTSNDAFATPDVPNEPLSCIQSRLLRGNTPLFHFIDLQTTLGVLIAANHSSLEEHSMQLIWSNFRSAASTIHQIFQRTLHGKENLKKCDLGGSWVQKDLIALREVSLLFSIPRPESAEEKKSELGGVPQFWVTGRLFLQPTLREFYVCYEESAPQNSMEIAHRLAAGLAP